MLRIFLALHLLVTWTTAATLIDVEPKQTLSSGYIGFGIESAMTDNWAIVISTIDYTSAINIYKNHAGNWSYATEILEIDSDFLNENDAVVDMTDNWAIIGSSDLNKAYILKNTAGTWDTTVAFVLTPPSSCCNFGRSVAMTDNWAIVGDPSGNKAYIFKNTAGTWDTTAAYVLTPLDAINREFGGSVDMTDNWAIVTSNDETLIFKNTAGTWDTTATVQLGGWIGPYAQLDGGGTVVAITDNWAIVSRLQYRYDMEWPNTHEGRALIFKNTAGTWDTTATVQLAGNENEWGYEWGFGKDLAITDDMAIVGAEDKAYIYENVGGTWNTNVTIIDGGCAACNFGMSVAMSDNWAIVGAPNNIHISTTLFQIHHHSCASHSSKLSADGSVCETCESGKYAWFGHHTECIDCEQAATLITMNQGGVYRNTERAKTRFIEAFSQDGACAWSLCGVGTVAENNTCVPASNSVEGCNALKDAYNSDGFNCCVSS